MSLGKRLISTDAAGGSDGSANFNTVIYNGAGGTQSITGVGFAPDFVWVKNRDRTNSHIINTTLFGTTAWIDPDGTGAANSNVNRDWFQSFDSDGFTVKRTAASGETADNWNRSGDKYVAWCWYAPTSQSISASGSRIASTIKKNVAAGFSIVKYEGTGSAATVGHGLSSAPEMVIVKNADVSGTNWWVWHSGLGDGTKYLNLTTTAGVNSVSSIWNSTVPTSTVFSVANDGSSNGNGNTTLAFCFHSVAGSQKVGSYTGDGQANRSVTTGFSPKFLLIKSTVGNDNWRLYDTVRGITAGGFLEPNNSDGDNTYAAPNITMTPTGFEITSGGVTAGNNTASNLYIYLAIA